MKILSRSDSQLVLSENGTAGKVFGVILLVAGIILEVAVASLPWWGGVILIAIGLIMLLTSTTTIITANKDIKKVNINQKSIIKSWNNDYDFDNILKIQLMTQYHQEMETTSNSDGQKQTRPVMKTYRSLSMITKDGQQVSLANSSSSQTTVNSINIGTIYVPFVGEGQALADMVGVQFEQITPTSTMQFQI